MRALPGLRRWRSSDLSAAVLIAVALAAATLFAYRDVGRFGFVTYDDPPYVSRNLAVQQGLTMDGLRYAFTTFELGNWHPLTWLSHMAVVQCFGPGPGPAHLANLLLHVLNVVLLFAVLRQATGSALPSAVVAALFALHPLHVESVAWISERKDVLSTSFWLVATGAYVAYARGRGRLCYAAAALSLVLGLMCKPMLVTLPFVFLLLDVWPLARARTVAPSRLLLEKLPLVGLVAAACVLTFAAQRTAGAVVPFPAGLRAANAVVSLLVYLRKTAWPFDLAVYYPYAEQISPLLVSVSAAVIAVLTAAAIACRRRAPCVAVGWFWFLGTLVPVIGLVQVGGQSLADRYTYVPHIGLFIAVVFGAAALLRRRSWGRYAAPVLSAAVLVPCLVLTHRQAATWSGDLELFGHALEVTDGNYLAHEKLAGSLLRSGRTDEAVAHLQESIRIRPSYAVAYNNLGNVQFGLGHIAEAEALFRQAIAFDPGLADAYSNLGLALCTQDKLAEGTASIEEALRLDPRHAGAHTNLATSLRREGRLQSALEHYRQALALDPGMIQAARGIAWIRATSADPTLLDAAEAVRLAERANVATGASDPPCLYTLAAAYARAGRFDEATRTAQHAFEIATAAGQEALAHRIRLSLARFEAGLPIEEGEPPHDRR